MYKANVLAAILLVLIHKNFLLYFGIFNLFPSKGYGLTWIRLKVQLANQHSSKDHWCSVSTSFVKMIDFFIRIFCLDIDPFSPTGKLKCVCFCISPLVI